MGEMESALQLPFPELRNNCGVPNTDERITMAMCAYARDAKIFPV